MKNKNILLLNTFFWVTFTIIILIDYLPIWSKYTIEVDNEQVTVKTIDWIILAFMNLIINCPLAWIFLQFFEHIYEKKIVLKLLKFDTNSNFIYNIYTGLTFFAIFVFAGILATVDGSFFLWLVTGEWWNFSGNANEINGIFSENGQLSDVLKYISKVLLDLNIINIETAKLFKGLSSVQVEKIHEWYRNVPEALFSFFLFVGYRKAIEYSDRKSILELKNNAFVQSQKNLQAELQYQKKLNRAGEKNLRWQIKPHAVSNALNGLKSAIYLDKPKDLQMDIITQTLTVMNYTFNNGYKDLVNLKDEFDFIENYIKRYDNKALYDNYIFDTRLPIVDEKLQIAPLLLIDLVENGIKYTNQLSPLKVKATIQKSVLEFEVENSFNPDFKGSNSSGVGLINLEKRLKILYDNCSLEKSIIDSIFKITLKIDLNTYKGEK